ncbi:MAG: hypothetical protein GWP02_00425 [Desulfobulbaceae bacterium]|nr:hypothetical protein [Desulfobulbaceae bacterium]
MKLRLRDNSKRLLLNDGEKLTILVKKVFVCLVTRDGEDESDMVPNPQADSGQE